MENINKIIRTQQTKNKYLHIYKSHNFPETENKYFLQNLLYKRAKT